MPKFIVQLQQYVEEIAEVTVDAGSAEEARQIALDNNLGVDADWCDGSDSYRPSCYGVKDAGGALVWER